MSGPSKVIVLDPDPRAGRQLRLGLAREGVEVVVVEPPANGASLELPKEAGLVLVGGADGAALELVRQARAQLAGVPIVFAGTGATRDALHAAGADEVVDKPAYLRDVVTIARIMAGVPPDSRDHLVGSLVETTGVFTLVRALAALGRSAVLTLIRGLRRGEVRFYHGEVTSAQVGLIHGQAALHQLLLWTDARFDFQHEDIVRRQQIPLSSEELFADAEGFLEGVRESAGGLSPAMILEQDVSRVHNLGKQIPTEVHGVLRMFDGHRVLADVLEDSPYRVFETLRVAQRAMEAGLLKLVDGQKPKATWKAVLAVEEWLVGKETRDAVVERTSQLDTGPVKSKKKRSKKPRKQKTLPMGMPAPKTEIDWGALVPRVIGAEVGPLSGVVPAVGTAGEIDVATRAKAREGLEALMDTDKRTKIFPTDIGLEPSVVVRGGDTDEWERIEWEAKARADAEEKAAEAEAKAEAGAKAKAEAEAKAAAEAEAKRKAAEEAEAQRARDEAQAQVEANVERMRLERIAREEAKAKAKEEAARANAAEEARTYAARVKAAAEAKRLEAEQAAREASIAKAEAAMVAQPIAPSTDDSATMPFERVTTGTDAKQLVADLVSEVVSKTPAVTVAETSTATISVSDILVVTTKADTAVVSASPTVTVTEVAPKPATEVPAPQMHDVSPSDGIVREVATADTAKLARERARRRPASGPPEDTGPPLKETSGELGAPKSKPAITPAASEPSILVADLAAVHAAATAAISKATTVPPPPDAASASRELAVAETRKDALAASEAEEAFFDRADSTRQHVPKIDTFDDLDEGYEPPGFWDRVFGRKDKKKP